MPLVTNDISTHFLYPSNLFVSVEPCAIQTILGSCVAICLYDQRLRIGGMNHYMMPFWNGTGLASPKYGNIAIESLRDSMISNGAKHQNMVAKIFGGAHQFKTISNSMAIVGDQNVHVAEALMQKYKIPVIAHSLGGTEGRKISFNTSTGVVLMKYIVRQDTNN